MKRKSQPQDFDNEFFFWSEGEMQMLQTGLCTNASY